MKCGRCEAWLTDAGMDVRLCKDVRGLVSIVEAGDAEVFEVHHDIRRGPSDPHTDRCLALWHDGPCHDEVGSA